MLLDGLGTLLRLSPPSGALRDRLRDLDVKITPEQASRAFEAEISYYLAHHLEGYDRDSLAALRARCAGVLHAELPGFVREAVSPARLLPVMLDCLRFSVYPEVPSTLAGLRDRGLQLILISNWDISLHQVLRTTGLTELIDGAITSAEVGEPKPAPAIFERALELAGEPARSAIHVGDSLAQDVGGALAAGIAPVLLQRASGAASAVHAGLRVIYSLSELLA